MEAWEKKVRNEIFSKADTAAPWEMSEKKYVLVYDLDMLDGKDIEEIADEHELEIEYGDCCKVAVVATDDPEALEELTGEAFESYEIAVILEKAAKMAEALDMEDTGMRDPSEYAGQLVTYSDDNEIMVSVSPWRICAWDCNLEHPKYHYTEDFDEAVEIVKKLRARQKLRAKQK